MRSEKSDTKTNRAAQAGQIAGTIAKNFAGIFAPQTSSGLHFDLSWMVIICVLILGAVLAANGRLQNVINAFNGSLGPQPANSGSSWSPPAGSGSQQVPPVGGTVTTPPPNVGP